MAGLSWCPGWLLLLMGHLMLAEQACNRLLKARHVIASKPAKGPELLKMLVDAHCPTQIAWTSMAGLPWCPAWLLLLMGHLMLAQQACNGLVQARRGLASKPAKKLKGPELLQMLNDAPSPEKIARTAMAGPS